jgi:hypothetical protein
MKATNTTAMRRSMYQAGNQIIPEQKGLLPGLWSASDTMRASEVSRSARASTKPTPT